jgi:peptidoglycan/xylan/chitin deacetylase (PgdA/CDA1 family)
MELKTQLEFLEQETGVRAEQYLQERMFLSWDEVKGMVAAGMEIGAHTRNHPMLSRVDDPATLRDEIAGSREDLAERLGAAPQAFAYPFGSADSMSPEADEQIRRAGFEVSFSYIPRLFQRPGHEGGSARWRVPRLPCEHGDDHRSFRVALATAPVASYGFEREDHALGKGMELCRT